MFGKASNPADKALAITPNDSTNLADGYRGLYIGGAGNVSLTTVEGDTVTFSNLPAGFILPVRVRRVRATGTTATDIVAVG